MAQAKKLEKQNLTIGKTIRARFSKGVIRPLEKVDMAEGKEIMITILDLQTASNQKNGLDASRGGWLGLVDAETLKRNIYADRLISTRPSVAL
jgi:predicted DNA-binding antitoxin AbrB/MazE fold protein